MIFVLIKDYLYLLNEGGWKEESVWHIKEQKYIKRFVWET